MRVHIQKQGSKTAFYVDGKRTFARDFAVQHACSEATANKVLRAMAGKGDIKQPMQWYREYLAGTASHARRHVVRRAS